jgi:hypothetical protein
MLGRSGTFYRAGYLARRANDWPDGTDGQADTQDDPEQAQTVAGSPPIQQGSSVSPVLVSESTPPDIPNADAENFSKISGQTTHGSGNGAARPAVGSSNRPNGGFLTGQELRQRMDASQPLLNSCKVPFSREIPGFSMGTFLNRMHNATYEQHPYTHPGGSSSVESDTDSTGPIFARTTRLYPDFFVDTPERQGAVLDHENIHRYTGWDDARVFREFARDGLNRNSPYGTDEITQWILRGCKPKD